MASEWCQVQTHKWQLNLLYFTLVVYEGHITQRGFGWAVHFTATRNLIRWVEVTREREPYPTLEMAQTACENWFERNVAASDPELWTPMVSVNGEQHET